MLFIWFLKNFFSLSRVVTCVRSLFVCFLFLTPFWSQALIVVCMSVVGIALLVDCLWGPAMKTAHKLIWDDWPHREKSCFAWALVLVEFALLGVSLVELVGGALLWSEVGLWVYLLWSLFGEALMQAKFSHHLCPALDCLGGATKWSTVGCCLCWAWWYLWEIMLWNEDDFHKCLAFHLLVSTMIWCEASNHVCQAYGLLD